MISFMGKEKEQGGGGFLILDGQTFKVKKFKYYKNDLKNINIFILDKRKMGK